MKVLSDTEGADESTEAHEDAESQVHSSVKNTATINNSDHVLA